MNLTTAHQTARTLLASAVKRLRPVRKRRAYTLGDSKQRLEEVSLRFQSTPLKLLVRPDTTDIHLIDMILREQSMYRLPGTVEPTTIFDVGANIGIAAVYFGLIYPNARVYCFEPLPQNLELLQYNTQSLGGRVEILPYGLSDRSGGFEYFMSDNPNSFGGGGFMQVGHNPSKKLSLPLKSVSEALAELGLNSVDLFKIDTEGSELTILQGIPQDIRNAAQAFVGELHGIGNWEVCDMLAQSHAVGIDKPFDARCFPFTAVRKDLAEPGQIAQRAA